MAPGIHDKRWKSGSYGSTFGDPRSAEGQHRVSRKSDGDTYSLHLDKLEGHGDRAKRTSKHIGDFGSEKEAQEAVSLRVQDSEDNAKLMRRGGGR